MSEAALAAQILKALHGVPDEVLAQLAVMYCRHGLKMLGIYATFEDGTNGLEAGIAEMLERMQTGCLKVFIELRKWQEECSRYHRKNGVIVKEHDDLITATRYAIMMRRHAKTRRVTKPQTRQRSL